MTNEELERIKSVIDEALQGIQPDTKDIIENKARSARFAVALVLVAGR